MRPLKADVIGNVALMLIFVAGWFFVGDGFKKTLGPFPDPVRYSWDSGKQCVVIYPNKYEVSCGNFTKEELNKFRLEYADPHLKPRRK